MVGAAPPLRPLSLRVENFRGLAGEHALDLRGDLTLLIGKNGAGKSSLLVAVEWCLFGAQATKKTGSGIAERGDWILAHEGATGDVRVTLELQVDGGSACLTRSRGAGAKVRDEDVVQLELPGNEVFRGDEIADWMAWNRMPDWSTWKRSFCQHQEQSRERVTDAADRATAIAAMLGLDEYRELNDDLRRPKASVLKKRAKEELERLHERQRQGAEELPVLLRNVEARLAGCGLDPARANVAELERRKGELVREAREIARLLGMDLAPLPDREKPASALLEWGPAWKSEVTRALDRLGRERRELSGKVQSLEASIASLAPARGAAVEAQSAWERASAQLGSIEDSREERKKLAQKRVAAEDDRRRLDAAGQLLRDAAAVLAASPSSRICPVCEQERTGLKKWIEHKLGEHGTQGSQFDFEQLSARDQKLEEQLERLAGLEQALAVAQRQVRALEENVRAQLPPAAGDDGGIDELLRSWREEERRAEESCEVAESYLSRHAANLEVLDLLVQVRDLRAGAGASTGDLTQIPAYPDLQRAIDEAAAFAGDLEALGAMARTLEDEQSEQQLAAVNQSIDTYLTTITGDKTAGRVRVKSKKTAMKVTYLLVDEGGRVITGKLNQAAFNALSLATLFASAESRARAGRPQFLVLDDPGQSLDADHLQGLARAIEKCARFAPVIVATFPGALADALSSAGPATYRVTRTGPGSDTRVRKA